LDPGGLSSPNADKFPVTGHWRERQNTLKDNDCQSLGQIIFGQAALPLSLAADQANLSAFKVNFQASHFFQKTKDVYSNQHNNEVPSVLTLKNNFFAIFFSPLQPFPANEAKSLLSFSGYSPIL
jgi:hypothetical protein